MRRRRAFVALSPLGLHRRGARSAEESATRAVAPRLLHIRGKEIAMSRSWIFIATIGVLSSCAACEAHYSSSAPPPPVYLTSETIPIDIETYPSTVYEGRTVYLYGDRWYYRDRDRWTYYHTEPEQLRRHRQYIQQAPPANHDERREHNEHR
jgi:hypothetical protein